MNRLDRLCVKYHNRTVGILSLTPDNKICAFQYDSAWLADGFSISPIELPLRPDLFVARPQPFYGNFGVFEDSLPDGYGRYLLHKSLMKIGVDDSQISAIDRLSIVGNGGMGALTYEPVTPLIKSDAVLDFDLLQAKALEVLSERSDDDAGLLLYNSRNSGGCRPKALFSDSEGHWLIKFRHTYDSLDVGRQEYSYNEVARNCGIDVPDFKLTNGRYFTVRRFDIAANGERLHMATAGGLLNVSLDSPVLDYRNLLALTAFLTGRQSYVEEMFRRMVFNYLVDNKDDHCKNFSFIVKPSVGGHWLWHLAPAYDLTLCTAGYNGEHATSVNGTGHPTVQDMLAVGAAVKLPAQKCLNIIDRVRSNCGELLAYDLR